MLNNYTSKTWNNSKGWYRRTCLEIHLNRRKNVCKSRPWKNQYKKRMEFITFGKQNNVIKNILPLSLKSASYTSFNI